MPLGGVIGQSSWQVLIARLRFPKRVFCNVSRTSNRFRAITVIFICWKKRDLETAARGRARSKFMTDSESPTPTFIVVFCGNYSSISYHSRVMSVFIPTGNDVITISGIKYIQFMWKWRILNQFAWFALSANSKFFLRLLPFRRYVMFYFQRWICIMSRKIGDFLLPTPCNLASTRLPKGTYLRQSTCFEPLYTLNYASLRSGCAWVRERWVLKKQQKVTEV